MYLIIGIIITFLVSGSVLYILNKNDVQQNKTIYKRSNFLCCASNKNSYSKARDVFKTLKEAGIEPNFLGGQHE